MVLVAVPIISTTMSNLHLSSAASSLSGAIQSARYQAISGGCPVQIAVSAQTYLVSAETITGTPPACSTTFAASSYGAIPYASSEISFTSITVGTGAAVAINTSNPSASFQLNPSGMVTAAGTTVPPTSFSLVLSQTKGSGIKTISVSGMGYVKII
jgi:Tfp pilus assembly protein FimT